jgi:hypothetical protein
VFLSIPDLGVYSFALDGDTLRPDRPGDSPAGALTISFLAGGEPDAAPAHPIPNP